MKYQYLKTQNYTTFRLIHTYKVSIKSQKEKKI